MTFTWKLPLYWKNNRIMWYLFQKYIELQDFNVPHAELHPREIFHKYYLKYGVGYAWAGHNKLKLWSRFALICLKSSPVVIFGLTLPMGSEKFIFINLYIGWNIKTARIWKELYQKILIRILPKYGHWISLKWTQQSDTFLQINLDGARIIARG